MEIRFGKAGRAVLEGLLWGSVRVRSRTDKWNPGRSNECVLRLGLDSVTCAFLVDHRPNKATSSSSAMPAEASLFDLCGFLDRECSFAITGHDRCVTLFGALREGPARSRTRSDQRDNLILEQLLVFDQQQYRVDIEAVPGQIEILVSG